MAVAVVRGLLGLATAGSCPAVHAAGSPAVAPWVDLELTLKRGSYEVSVDGRIRGWLAVRNNGPAHATGGGQASRRGYFVAFYIVRSHDALNAMLRSREAGRREPAAAAVVDETPNLGAAEEAVLRFEVPVPPDTPAGALVCGRIGWGDPGYEDDRRNNTSCSRLASGE